MFVGREEELAVLENLCERDGFQMAVVYGRRRVGKTALLERLARGRRTLFFTARIQSSKANLRDFSQKVAECFELPQDMPAFETWAQALSFIAKKETASPNPLLLVFDEFPYAASTEQALPSTLQVVIDHELAKTSMTMVLCGSNEGFMESKVLGRKSPLYGRRNAQIRLQPFDYLDAAKMLPRLAPQEAILHYASFGGTPYYLAQVDTDQSYEQNVERLFFSMYGLLYEEPLMLLRQELREPALYNSVLAAVGAGKTKPKQIAEYAGLEQASIAKYLKTLEGLGLIERIVPFGESAERSRKGIYRVKDPFFAYWYRFVAPNVGAIESGAGTAAARAALPDEALATYTGAQFETVCLQWLLRQNREGKLPFLASAFGKWWGTDPVAHEQVDIDVVAADKAGGEAVFGECKWRNSFDETQALAQLEHRASLVKGCTGRHFILFSKEATGAGTQSKAKARDDVRLVCADDLFD